MEVSSATEPGRVRVTVEAHDAVTCTLSLYLLVYARYRVSIRLPS